MPADKSIATRAAEKLAANKAAALTGALTLALGLAVGVAIAPDDPQRDAKLEQLGDAVAKGSAQLRNASAAAELDAHEYHDAIRKVRDADPQLVDLLSPPVEPAHDIAVGANFPRGARLVGLPELVGPAAGSFSVQGFECTERDEDPDNTWCEVRARNDSQETQRLIALVRWELASP